MFQPMTKRWVSQSDIPVTSWQRGSMTLHKDSNLSRCRLMSMILMDQSNNMKLFRKPTADDLALGPELIAHGLRPPGGEHQ
jgi:hypothetical protein